MHSETLSSSCVLFAGGQKELSLLFDSPSCPTLCLPPSIHSNLCDDGWSEKLFIRLPLFKTPC